MDAKKLSTFDRMLDWLGHRLGQKLQIQNSGYNPYTPSDYQTLYNTLEPGDVILVEGSERVSTAIKYLTQSTWSHATFFIGNALPMPTDGSERLRLIEVNIGEGCVAVPLSKYTSYNTRICRPVGLTEQERQVVVDFMIDKLGLDYDMRNIFDLLRYFLPTPPVHWRRRMLSVGYGDPTRAICSSLIAQAYQSIKYPILPKALAADENADHSREKVYHSRHHSYFAPRDFDLSPYFKVVKPTIVGGFDPHKMVWDEPPVKAIE